MMLRNALPCLDGSLFCQFKPKFRKFHSTKRVKGVDAAAVREINPNVEVVESPAIKLLFSIMRNKRTTQKEYVEAADRLMKILAEEGLARLPSVKPTIVETPCGQYEGLSVPATHKICGVDIVRSGGILLEALRNIAPDSKTAKILIQRCEETAEPKLYYSKLPPEIGSLEVVLCDPMLATGGSAVMAVEVLKDAGVAEENILFLNVLSCPEGLRRMAQDTPAVKVVTTAVDDGLDENKFIAPGLGDFGDRYYGTDGYIEGLWGRDGK